MLRIRAVQEWCASKCPGLSRRILGQRYCVRRDGVRSLRGAGERASDPTGSLSDGQHLLERQRVVGPAQSPGTSAGSTYGTNSGRRPRRIARHRHGAWQMGSDGARQRDRESMNARGRGPDRDDGELLRWGDHRRVDLAPGACLPLKTWGSGWTRFVSPGVPLSGITQVRPSTARDAADRGEPDLSGAF